MIEVITDMIEGIMGMTDIILMIEATTMMIEDTTMMTEASTLMIEDIILTIEDITSMRELLGGQCIMRLLTGEDILFRQVHSWHGYEPVLFIMVFMVMGDLMNLFVPLSITVMIFVMFFL